MGIAKASVFYVMNFVCEEEVAASAEDGEETVEGKTEIVDYSVSRV